MQIINQIGHIQHWGLSPAINVLKDWTNKPEPNKPLRILLSGCSDIRHILKTLCDISTSNKSIQKIQFYFHETKVQLLCRMLLLIHIVHETQLNYEERTELFLDLFGNAMIKQRNARYLNNLKQDLLNFVHSEDKVFTPLKKIVNLKLLKFQQRDQMSEFIQSWSLKVDFDMEKLRDQKLRYLFKERYDFKANLVDWDHNMNLIPVAPIVHFYHYKEWRLSGLAFEQRFSTYCQPNRTLASYAEGKRKQSRTSCLVRGYWGDIVMSPYISLGVRCDYPQKQLLFKKANYKHIGHSVELSIYNMFYWLYRLQEDKEYVKVFRDYYRTDQKTKKQLEEKDEEKKKIKKNQKQEGEKLEQIQEKIQENEEDIQLKQQNKEEKVLRKQQEFVENKSEEKKNEQPRLKKIKKNKDTNQQQLDSDQQRQKKQVEKINSKQIQLSTELPVLKGFQKYSTQIYPMAMSSDNLMKPKFNDFFDVIVLGFVHSAYLKQQRNICKLLKSGGNLLVQRSTFLVPKKMEQRKQLDSKLQQLIQQYQELIKINESDQCFVYKKHQ